MRTQQHSSELACGIDALADALRPLPKAWLEREVKAGRIPSIKAGRRRVFDLHAVRAAIARQAAKGGG